VSINVVAECLSKLRQFALVKNQRSMLDWGHVCTNACWGN
jgi:hypothetical protein